MWINKFSEVEDSITSGFIHKEDKNKVKETLKRNIGWFSRMSEDGEPLLHLLIRANLLEIVPEEILTREFFLKKDQEGVKAIFYAISSEELLKLPEETMNKIVKEEDFTEIVSGENPLHKLAEAGMLGRYLKTKLGKKAITVKSLLIENSSLKNCF